MCVKGCHEVVSQRLNRRNFLKTAAAATVAGTVGHGTTRTLFAAPEKRMKHIRYRRIVDLTHTFRAGFPTYTRDNPTRRTLANFAEHGFYAQEWTFGEHSGTHMDAPGHFIPGGRQTPDISAEELVMPLAVVDIRAKVANNPDALVTVDDIRNWEAQYGPIPDDACVAMYSGWEEKVHDEEAFLGVDEAGGYHFPGFGIDAVEFLLAERNIRAIAVDTLSLDNGPSTTFDVHFRLLGADRFGFENVANLGQMPANRGIIIPCVIPWEEGSGGPGRVLGFAQ